jgi:ubiquinone/menaquinone biosynthesis C-methylase UbiE
MPSLDVNPGSTVKVRRVDADTIPNHHRDHAGFGGVSGVLCALLFRVRHRRRSELAIRLTGAGPGDTVVDIGCGSGATARRAAALGATAIGIDPAPVMLRVARLTSRHRRLRYAIGTAEALPVDDGAATVAWSIATVHHWDDLDAGVAEVHRVLRAGGRFLALERRTTPDATGVASHGWTPERAQAFADHLSSHGFTDVTIEEHGTDPTLLAVRATRD